MAAEQRPPPVIFLDIDGVLNRTKHAKHICIDADCVERLRRLVEETDAVIVLSTFWRYFDRYIAYILHRHGIDQARVVGITPGTPPTAMGVMASSAADDSNYANRAEEIEAWLSADGGDRRFVVLDDRRSASNARLAPNFVRTDAATGLTDADVQAAIALLRPPRGADAENAK